MSRTHGIREKMGFSLSEHIKGVLEAKNIKEILENAMDLNSTYKDQFDQETQKQIAKCIMEFLEKWRISINTQKINQGRWEYLTKKQAYHNIKEVYNAFCMS